MKHTRYIEARVFIVTLKLHLMVTIGGLWANEVSIWELENKGLTGISLIVFLREKLNECLR